MDVNNLFNDCNINSCRDIIINWTSTNDELINEIRNLVNEQRVLNESLQCCVRIIERLIATNVTVNADGVDTVYSECDKKSEIESHKEVICAINEEISALKTEIDLIKNK